MKKSEIRLNLVMLGLSDEEITRIGAESAAVVAAGVELR
jgi:hypothetical protein